MPKLPHQHAHMPVKGQGISKCRCGDAVPTPAGPVKVPPREVAPLRKPLTWEGLRRAVQPFTDGNGNAVTEAVVTYLLKHGVEVEPPFERGDVATAGDTSYWDDRPDPLAPCPLTGGRHRWRWADDGMGHSGDRCKCGAFEE